MVPSLYCGHAELLDRIRTIDPKKYASTRNFLDGQVTWLSPFLTHGVLDTAQLGHAVIAKHGAQTSYKFLAELGWREFFHRTWLAQGDAIHNDIKRQQENVISQQIPSAFLNASTGITAIDQSIRSLIDHGTMHNHARMWVASLISNICQTQWQEAAAWMHYHLLDGDLASNSLSWQWIAGTFSHRKYIANQENINRYSKSVQADTPVDISYPELAELTTPSAWAERSNWRDSIAPLTLPTSTLSHPIKPKERIALHSIWNLAPQWLQGQVDRHILVLEPSYFERHPMAPNRLKFILHWAQQIPELEIFTGEITDLPGDHVPSNLIHQEYPSCQHWPGTQQPRNWLYSETSRPYASFSSFWKHAQKQIGLGTKSRKLHQ